jgi:tetratricopeptide (TPR) repeat protein
MLEQVEQVDFAPATIAAVLARTHQVVAATAGTEKELGHRGILAGLLGKVGHVQEAEAHLRTILSEAIRLEQFGTASIAASELGDFLRRAGRLDEALSIVEQVPAYTARARYGPWTQLNDEILRLEVLVQRGEHAAVLRRVIELSEEMKALPDPPGTNEIVRPPLVREKAYQAGFQAAVEQGAWRQALELNAANRESKRARGATPLALAQTEFGNYGALLELQRYDEARDLLVHCREIFEREDDLDSIGITLSALADLEHRLGRLSEAQNFGEAALRFLYISNDRGQIAACHHNLAVYIGDLKRVSEALAHRVAAVLIAVAMQSGRAAGNLAALVHDLRNAGPEGRAALPADFGALCATVEKIEGVRFREMIERLAGGPAECDQVFERVIATVLEHANKSE